MATARPSGLLGLWLLVAVLLHVHNPCVVSAVRRAVGAGTEEQASVASDSGDTEADSEDGDDDNDSGDDSESKPAVVEPPPPRGRIHGKSKSALLATRQRDAVERNMQALLAAEEEVMNPNTPMAKEKQELAANLWLEDELKEKLDSMSEDKYREKISNAEKAVASETTEGLATMLGKMRTEMHKFAAPFYKQAIEQQIDEVHLKTQNLRKEIRDGEKGKSKKPEAEVAEPQQETEVQAAKPEEDKDANGIGTVRNSTRTTGLFLWATALIVLVLVVFIATLFKLKQHPGAFAVDDNHMMVSIFGASGLTSMNHFVGDALYVVCEVTHKERKPASTARIQTGVLKNTLNPNWNETHQLPGWQQGDSLTFTVFDKGMLGSRVEGKVTVESDQAARGFDGELLLTTAVDPRQSPQQARATLRVKVVPPRADGDSRRPDSPSRASQSFRDVRANLKPVDRP